MKRYFERCDAALTESATEVKTLPRITEQQRPMFVRLHLTKRLSKAMEAYWRRLDNATEVQPIHWWQRTPAAGC